MYGINSLSLEDWTGKVGDIILQLIAAMFLSVNKVIITTVSIGSKAMSREMRGEALTCKNLATARILPPQD